jgi:hypothetical protein
MRRLALLMMTFLLSASFHGAFAEGVLMGVNFWGEGFIPKATWDNELQQMAKSGVKTIRTSLFPTTVDFIVQASQHSIGSVVIVYPFLGATAKAKGGWARYALSELNPQEFTAAFKPLFDKLEAAGVRLAAFELGNEINATGSNGDLSDPGSGRELKLADLNNANDPEGRAAAAGYRNYVRIIAALKDLRDRSKLNQHTPIISAGLAQKLGTRQTEVNLHDSIAFWRQDGMVKLVDGYGIHVYPSADLTRPVAARIDSLEKDMFSACRSGDKPCWITEWGFGNSTQSCPAVDATRVKLVQSMRSAFQHFARQGLLAALMYYDWAISSGKPDSWAIFRCGAVTEAGKLALSPM